MAFINDGFSTTITIAGTIIPTVFLVKEKTVTPPGLSGGGGIDTTTMRNSAVRTKAPKSLFSLDNLELSVSYDPLAYNLVISTLINSNRTFTVDFPDGSILTFLGFLDEFKPQTHTEGEQPLANIVIIPSLCSTPSAAFITETLPSVA